MKKLLSVFLLSLLLISPTITTTVLAQPATSENIFQDTSTEDVVIKFDESLAYTPSKTSGTIINLDSGENQASITIGDITVKGSSKWFLILTFIASVIVAIASIVANFVGKDVSIKGLPIGKLIHWLAVNIKTSKPTKK